MIDEELYIFGVFVTPEMEQAGLDKEKLLKILKKKKKKELMEEQSRIKRELEAMNE